MTGRRSSPSLALVLAFWVLSAPAARPAELAPKAQAELRRALAMVGPSTSEEPAVRQEGRAREPSAAFMLGAALGAWINAAAQLDFDISHPAAAGPPHVSQTGGDADAFAQDCADETAAFGHLRSRAEALNLTPAQVAAAATLDGAVAGAWRARAPAPPAACR